MASTRLTDDEVTAFIMKANDYVKLSVPYNTILPVKRIPESYIHTWYVNREMRAPAASDDGREGLDVRTDRTSSSANVTSYVYTFEIPKVEVEMARQAGYDIWSENVAGAMRKMNDTILHLQIRGSNDLWDKVAITGMYGGGTDTNGALDDDKWDTVTNPIDDHLASGWGDLYDAGYKEPFTWLLTSNLKAGLLKKYGAGDPPQIDLLPSWGVNELIFLPGSGSSATATSAMNLYPMGTPAGDEGMWFLYKKNPNYAYLAEVMPPTTTIKPELDFRRQSYHGRVEWRGTVAIVQATSIVYEDQVDLV